MNILRRQSKLVIASILLAMCMANSASAQRAGPRGLGQPIVPGVAPGVAGAARPVQGTERYLRSNRSRRDFVGTSRSDLQGFVGSKQAVGVGRVPAAVGGLPKTSGKGHNSPLPPLAKGRMYYPRLSVDGLIDEPGYEVRRDELATDFVSRVRDRSKGTVEVEVNDRTAILRGVVASEKEKEMLGIMASFEPGVDQVENLVTIETPASSK